MDDPVEGEQTEVGALLAELRRRRGVTQRQLSETAGFATAYVGKVESKKPEHRIVPTRDAVERLAAALQASTDEHEALQRAAGHLRPGERLNPPSRPRFDVFLQGDPNLTGEQRRMLVTLYAQYVRANRGLDGRGR